MQMSSRSIKTIYINGVLINFPTGKLKQITGIDYTFGEESNEYMGVASIGDISTFLGKDPYYPFYSISKRYSFLNADISQGNTSLYLTFSKAYDPSSYDSINIIFESMVNLSSDDISLFLIDSFNIVRGPKEGIIPTSEDEVSIS